MAPNQEEEACSSAQGALAALVDLQMEGNNRLNSTEVVINHKENTFIQLEAKVFNSLDVFH